MIFGCCIDHNHLWNCSRIVLIWVYGAFTLSSPSIIDCCFDKQQKSLTFLCFAMSHFLYFNVMLPCVMAFWWNFSFCVIIRRRRVIRISFASDNKTIEIFEPVAWRLSSKTDCYSFECFSEKESMNKQVSIEFLIYSAKVMKFPLLKCSIFDRSVWDDDIIDTKEKLSVGKRL